MFNVGDRVRFQFSIRYMTSGWSFMDGAQATVNRVLPGRIPLLYVDWDDHEKGAPAPTETLQSQGYAWYDGGWETHLFVSATPLTPFEESVRAYISKELQQ